MTSLFNINKQTIREKERKEKRGGGREGRKVRLKMNFYEL